MNEVKRAAIYNPAAGSSLDRQALVALTDRHGVMIDDWIALDDAAEKKLESYKTSGGLVYVFGGDGTISSVAGMLVDSSALLVPMPGGTLNHFAGDLGIAMSLDDALSQSRQWQMQAIDIASVNGHYFINNSSLGLYARTLLARAPAPKLLKWPLAFAANLRALFQLRRYHLTIDAAAYSTPMLFVGNNRYRFSNGRFGRLPGLAHGELSLVIVQTRSRLSTLRVGLSTLFGRKDPDLLPIDHLRECTIHSRRRTILVARDGEVSRLASPLHYKIHSHALKVLAPTLVNKK